ncbi:MAG: hypothetical protein AB7O59_03490 [Pirellulales bacterium]
MAALVLTADLMLQSQLAGAAARAQATVALAGNAEALCARLAENSLNHNGQARLVALDLSVGGLNVEELVTRIRALAPEATILAFGPHVQHERLETAKAAGCDMVISRGKFHAEMDALLARYAAAAGP